MAEKQFTIEGLKDQLFDWALENDVKYVPSDVYHMFLLREPDVVAFFEKKKINAIVLADAIEEDMKRWAKNSGSQAVGNREDTEGRYSSQFREYRDMLRMQKEAEQDPMLKAPEEEKSDLDKRIERNLFLQKVIRFADDEETASLKAKTKAKLSGREEPTALEVYEAINIGFISHRPAVYEAAGLSTGLHQSIMTEKGFWSDKPLEPKPEPKSFRRSLDFSTGLGSLGMEFEPFRPSLNFSKKSKDKSSELISPEKKLNIFLQNNPDSASYLQDLVKKAVEEVVNKPAEPQTINEWYAAQQREAQKNKNKLS